MLYHWWRSKIRVHSLLQCSNIVQLLISNSNFYQYFFKYCPLCVKIIPQIVSEELFEAVQPLSKDSNQLFWIFLLNVPHLIIFLIFCLNRWCFLHLQWQFNIPKHQIWRGAAAPQPAPDFFFHSQHLLGRRTMNFSFMISPMQCCLCAEFQLSCQKCPFWFVLSIRDAEDKYYQVILSGCQEDPGKTGWHFQKARDV